MLAIKEHSISSDALFWLCKERGAGVFGDLLDFELMTSVFSALERDQFYENRRGSKLHDLLIDDRDLVTDIMINTPFAQARDLMRRMMLTPAFEELNKRSLMARMIKVHPELQSMLTGDSEEKVEALVVSWSSLQKRKEEYDDLISKRIPENTKEIGIARSYGDLRENFEYKAAKEMQTVLMRRKAELEQLLQRARGSNFENADTSQVSIGTKVTLLDGTSGEEIEYKILGAWDSAPEERIISYQTAIGQALLGKKIGDAVELPTETASRHRPLRVRRPTAPAPRPGRLHARADRCSHRRRASAAMHGRRSRSCHSCPARRRCCETPSASTTSTSSASTSAVTSLPPGTSARSAVRKTSSSCWRSRPRNRSERRKHWGT